MKAAIFFVDTKVKEAFEVPRASTHVEDRELADLLDKGLRDDSCQRFLRYSDPEGLPAAASPDNEPLEVQLLQVLEADVYGASDGDTIAVIIEWLDYIGYDRRFGY